MEGRYNCWTGRTTYDVTPNGRVVTDGQNPVGQLFRAEFWGDYSIEFPKFGPWRKSMHEAKRDLSRMSK